MEERLFEETDVPVLSVRVNVIWDCPAWVGMPVMRPVVVSRFKPYRCVKIKL